MSEPIAVNRRLVTVFAADVEGYLRLMGADEVGRLKGLTKRRAILDKAIADHRGRIFNTADNVLPPRVLSRCRYGGLQPGIQARPVK